MFLTRMGSAVCHRMAERSFLWGQGTMPLCARCTGIYVGVLLAFCFLLLKRRMDGGRPFSKGQAMLTALMISADWDRRTGQLFRLLGKQSAAACAFG
ncbi:MAG: DUF2085 domain-containing protein [Anaerotignum faecicola]